MERKSAWGATNPTYCPMKNMEYKSICFINGQVCKWGKSICEQIAVLQLIKRKIGQATNGQAKGRFLQECACPLPLKGRKMDILKKGAGAESAQMLAMKMEESGGEKRQIHRVHDRAKTWAICIQRFGLFAPSLNSWAASFPAFGVLCQCSRKRPIGKGSVSFCQPLEAGKAKKAI